MAVFVGIIVSVTLVSCIGHFFGSMYKSSQILFKPFLFIGISQAVYWEAVRNGGDIDWRCTVCLNAEAYSDSWADVNADSLPGPDAESTRVENGPEDSFTSVVDPGETSLHASVTVEETAESAHSAESSLEDPTPVELSSHFEVTYEVVEQSSKRGRPKLIDSQGYSYNMQRQRGAVIDWRCTVRPKANPCRATVRQRGNKYQRRNHQHNHQAKVGALAAAKITANVKAKATADLFRPAPAIVDEVTE